VLADDLAQMVPHFGAAAVPVSIRLLGGKLFNWIRNRPDLFDRADADFSEIRFFAQRKVPFAFEATLSGRSYLRLIRQLKKQGYHVHVFFLWVRSVDVALSRVRDRVLKGGHDVPEPVIRRRFGRSIRNFLAEYRPLADSWYLFDNSGATPAVIAFERAHNLRIMDAENYEALTAHYGEK